MAVTSAGVAERIVGQYPLSVSTSLALEGANGIYPERPESPAPILQFEALWVNLRTLLRNLLGSLDKVTASMIHPDELAATLVEEMEQISDIVAESSRRRCKAVYYVNHYGRLAQQYPHARIREDLTPRQKETTSIQNRTLALMLAQNPHRDEPILVFDLKLRPAQTPGPVVLLLTHYAYDLLSARAFRRLTLLESHTGRLKEKALWHTKYQNGRDLVMIPFREDLLQVFGDAECFAPWPIKIRKAIVDIATRMNWNPTTTTDRIRLGIEFIQDPYTREILKSMLTRQ